MYAPTVVNCASVEKTALLCDGTLECPRREGECSDECLRRSLGSKNVTKLKSSSDVFQVFRRLKITGKSF